MQILKLVLIIGGQTRAIFRIIQFSGGKTCVKMLIIRIIARVTDEILAHKDQVANHTDHGPAKAF